ncbi:MAG: VOC family protein [Acidobacteriota bacterium]
MRLDTYVNFAGRCAEAFRYYETHLGGAIEMMTTHDQTPGSSRRPAEWQQAVLHARLRIGDAVLMGADIPNAEPMRSAYLTLRVDRDADAERIYAALSDRGRILMPMAETFYASRFAQVQDQFGLNWMIMCERPHPQP